MVGKIFELEHRQPTITFLMDKNAKFRFLNAMLASGSPFANDICADASQGIELAIKMGEANSSLENFAKKMLRLYDSQAHIEVIDFQGEFFDPLFVFARIAETAKRLSGYERAILVITSLERAGISENGRLSKKRKLQSEENMELLESILLRYQTAFSNLEIIFI